MDVRKVLEDRFEASVKDLPDIRIEPFDAVPVSYQNEGTAGSIKHCVEYIRKNRGITYNGIGKKGRIVRKFLSFWVDPMVAQQNNIDRNFTVALLELFKLYRERETLYNRINALEAEVCRLESET